MKAIGIALIVFGHAPGLDTSLKTLIYSFHMPLFFFISGVLLSEQKLALSPRQYVLTLWKGLGLPYLFFFFISYLYWLPSHRLSAHADTYAGVGWWEPLRGVLIGNGDALYVNAVLWFFTCLISTALIYFVARRYRSALFLAIAMNLAGLAFVLLHRPDWPRLMWGLDNAFVALAFFSMGQWFRQRQVQVFSYLGRGPVITFAWLAALGLVYLAKLNGGVDLNTLHFGRSGVLYFLNAYLGIFVLITLGWYLPSNRVFLWLARNTIIIFPLHLLMFGVLTGVAVLIFKLPPDFKQSAALWTILFPTIALLLCYPAASLLYRFVPQIFGTRHVDVSDDKPSYMKRLLGTK